MIVKDGDDVLRKISREVTAFDDKCKILLDDMKETMAQANGIGIAAPQVGVLKRIFLIDLHDENGLIEFINPVIIETKGEQIFCEGCLSIPDFEGNVKRPAYVKIKAYDRNGNEFIYEGEELGAVCVSHEYDHLDGILFKDKVIPEESN